MQYDRGGRRPLTVRDLQADAEFFHEVQLAAVPVGARPSSSADAEAWLAAQAWHDAAAASPSIGWPVGDGLLAEGCEDCVRDLTLSAARRRQ